MDFLALAQQCAPMVEPSTLAAIVKTESGFNPLAIGINGGAKLVRQPLNKAEAVVTAQWLIGRGYNIDMGYGQINVKNLARLGLGVEDVFDPCKNLNAAGRILKGNYEVASQVHRDQQTALHAALSAYNTGSLTRGFQNGYVQKVVNNAGSSQPVQPIPVFMPTPSKPARPLASGTSQPLRLAVEETPGASATVFGSKGGSGVMVY